MGKIGIVIITYNVPSLIKKQIDLIRKYCKDEYDIVVVDNSNDAKAIEDIEYYTRSAGVERVKVQSASGAGSESNIFACNTAYYLLKDRYDYFFYLDHDTFPLKEFSVLEELGDKIMRGVPQEKSKRYYQQTSLMWDNIEIDRSLIDFSASHELGLDSGGLLYKVIEKYGDRCGVFTEGYYENPYFKHPPYNFYACINNDMFMHFINSSGWNPVEGNSERLNSLINVLNERTNG